MPLPLNADISSFSGVTSHSQSVRPGNLFVAVRGTLRDGHDFIDEAVSRGARAVIGERALSRPLPVPYAQVQDSRLALAEAACAYHGDPSRGMKVVAVTGTSGKTTVTFLIEAIFRAAGFRSGVLGTVSFRYDSRTGEKTLPSTHTTPGPVELQALLALMKKEGVTHVVMEVSSHALEQRRVYGIAFDAMAFTNLSPEHLDYHRDMENYFAAKSLLFTELFAHARAAGKNPVRAVNIDDTYGMRLAAATRGEALLTFSAERDADISGRGLTQDLDGIHGQLGSLEIESPLIGGFNVSNLLTAVAVARGLGIDDAVIGRGIRALHGVPGRMERVLGSAASGGKRGVHVIVDYAHKPDALKKVLTYLQPYRSQGHRLITVFGCGGDRDRSKRPVMGAIAQELSDLVVVTSDNPRNEDPDAIIREISAGIACQIEPDRRKAIALAIREAKPGDLILLAGKGHEDYQLVGTRKYPFDDRKVAAEFLDFSF